METTNADKLTQINKLHQEIMMDYFANQLPLSFYIYNKNGRTFTRRPEN